MGLTSLQVCMDSSDWLQGNIQGGDESSPSGMESSPSPLSPNDMLTCQRPLNVERRLRPPQDQSLKCPRCDSTHTKFCYYNNYSLSQPRYFCKTCRRYWTKGGTLRNIPVGGGCRKNKKPSSSSKKQNDNAPLVVSSDTTDLQLSFPDHALTGFSAIDFLESKMEGIMGNSHKNIIMGNNSNNSNNFDFIGNSNADLGNMVHQNLYNMEHNFNHPNICAPFGLSTSLLENVGPTMGIDTCQRMVVPYEVGPSQVGLNLMDVKPSAKTLLSLDWQQQDCSNERHVGNYGNWSAVINNYGPSTTNNLV